MSTSEKYRWRVRRVPPLRGLVLRANTAPPLSLHFVQGKRGGLRCFVPGGTGAGCVARLLFVCGVCLR
jgi:hypothetical protein